MTITPSILGRVTTNLQEKTIVHCVVEKDLTLMKLKADLGMSLDSKSADKELKAVTPEKSKSCVTAFTKKLVTTFQLSRTRSGHISLK